MNKFQQGDVIIKSVKSIPKTAKEVKADQRGYIIASGETTGHAHVIEPSETLKVFSDGNSLFMSLLAPQKIKHEEHKEIEIPTGKYKIGIVREVDPFENEIRKVRD